MKKLDEDKYGDTQQYRIERWGEFVEAINHFKPRVGLENEDASSLISTGRVRNADKQPHEFPYVVVLTENEIGNGINCVFVKPSAFIASPDDVEHLYEFSIRRTGRTSPYRVYETQYQIVARDPFAAQLRVGQVHHRDEEYDIEVISWQQVR